MSMEHEPIENRPEYSRNLGFWSREEQAALCDSTVALGGAGGDGFQLGMKLAQMGVQRFRLADPEVFEPENSNRVPGATQSNMGRNKAEVLAETILDLRPDAEVVVYKEGLTVDNIEEFVHGADLTIDETELTYPEIGTALAREARKNNIPNLFVMNIGFAAVATSFAPGSLHSFERMMGLPEGAPLDEIAEQSVDFSRCLPYIPAYADLDTLRALTQDDKEGALTVDETAEDSSKRLKVSLPSIAPGVDLASAMGSTEAFLHLARDAANKRRQPTWAPTFRYMDAYSGSAGTVPNARLGYYAGILTMATRSKLGVNPKASYGEYLAQ